MKKTPLVKLTLVLSLVASPLSYADPAIIITQFGCGLTDGFGGFVFTTDSHTVISYDTNGNTILKCKAEEVAHPGGEAIHWNYNNTGMMCGTYLGGTSDWQEVVTSSGNAILTCKIVPNPIP